MNYLKTSDISKYTLPLKLVEERPRSKIKYGNRQTLSNLMMVSKFNKDKQELLVTKEQTSQLICNNNYTNKFLNYRLCLHQFVKT